MDDFSFLVLLVVCARRLVRLVGWIGFGVGGGIASATASSDGGYLGGSSFPSFGFGDESNDAFGAEPADEQAKAAADNHAGNIEEVMHFADIMANFCGWIHFPTLNLLGGFRADEQAAERADNHAGKSAPDKQGELEPFFCGSFFSSSAFPMLAAAGMEAGFAPSLGRGFPPTGVCLRWLGRFFGALCFWRRFFLGVAKSCGRGHFAGGEMAFENFVGSVDCLGLFPRFALQFGAARKAVWTPGCCHFPPRFFDLRKRGARLQFERLAGVVDFVSHPSFIEFSLASNVDARIHGDLF